MKSRWPALFITGWALGCGGGAKAGEEQAPADDAAAEVATTIDPNDPCNLVSQSDMERFLGPLMEAPYRTDDREPDPAGTGCLYRGKDFRNVTLEVDREDGELGFRMMAGMGGNVEEMLKAKDASPAAMPGNWDKIGRAFGQLIALKGPASVQIDPLGSKLDLPQQVEIIRIALDHLQQPLPYDGGGAARRRKDVGASPRNPCTLVTRAEVEALMGKLRADPHPSEDGMECVFPLAAEFLGTQVDRSLGVQWRDGYYALGQERQSMGMASKTMAASMGADIPKLGENVAGEKEPWDERITMLGGVIIVVRNDVLLRIAADGVNGFDESKALTLLRTAAGRL